MIDLEKKYYTKNGCEVKLSHIDGEKAYGYYKDKKSEWVPAAWDVSTCWFGYREGSFLDLVEVKKRIKQTLWMNVHKGNAYGYPTKEVADAARFKGRLACVKVEIDL